MFIAFGNQDTRVELDPQCCCPAWCLRPLPPALLPPSCLRAQCIFLFKLENPTDLPLYYNPALPEPVKQGLVAAQLVFNGGMDALVATYASPSVRSMGESPFCR